MSLSALLIATALASSTAIAQNVPLAESFNPLPVRISRENTVAECYQVSTTLLRSWEVVRTTEICSHPFIIESSINTCLGLSARERSFEHKNKKYVACLKILLEPEGYSISQSTE